MATILLGIGALVFLAHAFAYGFSKRRVPDVLLLTLVGIALGPVLHIVSTTDFGAVGGVLGTLALVVLLFESGTSLDLTVLNRALAPTLWLSLVTFLCTLVLVACIGVFGLELSWTASILMGGALAGTSSAVVIPLARGLPLGEEARTVLILESALTDVLCIVTVFAGLQTVQTGAVDPFKLGGSILSALLFAGILGVLGGVVWLAVLDVVRRFPNSLFATVAFVLLVYGVTELLGFSGAIASLAFGLTLTNHEQMRVASLLPARLRHRDLPTLSPLEIAFFGEATFLLKTFFFVYLGVSIRVAESSVVLWSAVIVVLVYLLRLVVTNRTVRSTSSRYDAAITSTMVPKGLAAAVLASLPRQAGVPGGEIVQDVVFSVVLLSIVLTAALVFLVDLPWVRRGYDRIFHTFSAEIPPGSPARDDGSTP